MYRFLHWCDQPLNWDKQINPVINATPPAPFIRGQVLPPGSGQKTVIHAFIISCLDYCNALYTGLNHSTLSRPDLASNAAARLLSNTKKRDRTYPSLTLTSSVLSIGSQSRFQDQSTNSGAIERPLKWLQKCGTPYWLIRLRSTICS